MEKQKIIIYGLGEEFKRQRKLLEEKYVVVGYSDRKLQETNTKYISPKDIINYEFDYIYITSRKYFDEIKSELESIVGNKTSFLGLTDIIGEYENVQVRDRWVATQLEKIPVGKTILDAGAGEMKYAKFCKHLKYISQDFGEYVPNESNEGLQSKSWDYSHIMVKCDITAMPFEDESIDVILCTEVFEHIKNPISALEEFHRLLRPGGYCILTSPFASLVHMAPHYYHSGFSKYWYEKNLDECGFKIVELNSYGDYFSWIGQELLRLPDVGKRYCGCKFAEDEWGKLYEVLELIKKCNSINNQSDDLLCFGYLVKAEKKEKRI